MDPNISRRCVLRAGGGMLAAGLLAACQVTKSGNVTTLTLNVAEIRDYAQAGLNAVSTVLGIGAVASGIGAAGVGVITAADTILSAALDSFCTAAGSTLAISYDDTNWKSRVDSILSALGGVENDLNAAITGVSGRVPGPDLSSASTALNALGTIVAAFRALLDSVGARHRTMATAAPAPAQVRQALGVLGVVAP
ncbi:hypothetical protein DY926_16425 [Komagataeibacter melaceti]|uniref:Lipoprotein n=1 Tax=Komagataeibacter melaceti TaxID=2766577 RepID=A0A371YW70_9PROT|nr:hypothetical protein [Komagataeibacter melaceti]RFD18480.1 hypothetical protein DY926_16425 [Komagataeibacter melaceti]